MVQIKQDRKSYFCGNHKQDPCPTHKAAKFDYYLNSKSSKKFK